MESVAPATNIVPMPSVNTFESVEQHEFPFPSSQQNVPALVSLHAYKSTFPLSLTVQKLVLSMLCYDNQPLTAFAEVWTCWPKLLIQTRPPSEYLLVVLQYTQLIRITKLVRGTAPAGRVVCKAWDIIIILLRHH